MRSHSSCCALLEDIKQVGGFRLKEVTIQVEVSAVVRTDLENLHASLEKSGFTVRPIGTDGASQTGRSKILQALRRECREAIRRSFVLVFACGSGQSSGFRGN